MTTTILWISRHTPQVAQIDALVEQYKTRKHYGPAAQRFIDWMVS